MDDKRCFWALRSPEELHYHDHEWGRPHRDDASLYEFMILEMMQAGLSWTTIIRKREGMRKAFADFDPQAIAAFDQDKLDELLMNPDIIRNRLKLKAMVENTKIFLEIQKEFGSFSNYLWSYVKGDPVINRFEDIKDVPARTELSDQISLDLKKRGFKFFGTTICYAYLQAMGLVHDHVISCPFHMEYKGRA